MLPLSVKYTIALCSYCICLFVTHANAQQIRIDGKLDEPAWQQAQVFNHYVQSFPDTGQTPAFNTTTYLLSRPEGIYVGFANQQIERSRKYSGHDQFTSADFTILFIDFNGDGNTAYEFVATLGGGTMDGTYSRGNTSNRDWDGSWQVAVSEQGDHWYSEYFIPWSVATYKNMPGDQRQITLYFQRNNVVAGQAYSLPDTNRSRQDFTYRFLPVKVTAPSAAFWSATPYLSGQYNANQLANQVNVGLDMIYKPTSNQQWIASLNPDFGQIESDELIVNYSAIETLRTDKRPFFTENQSLFDLRGPDNLRLLNTRRIGGLAENGKDIHDILAAVKYIYSGNWLDAGMLAVREQDAGESKGKTVLSGRWQHAGQQLTYGQLINYVHNPNLARTAWVSNVDAQYRLSQKTSLFTNLLASRVSQNGEAQGGLGATLTANYLPYRHWKNTLEISAFSDDLMINDAGYLARNNIRKLFTSSRYDDYTFAKDSPWRRFRYYGEGSTARNGQGENLANQFYLSLTAQLKSKHLMRVALRQKNAGIDDVIRRGFGSAYLPAQQRWDLFYQSPSPAPFSYSVTASRLQEGVSDWAERLLLSTRSYFTDQLRLDLSVTHLDSPDWLIGLSDGNINQYRRRLKQVNAKFVGKLSPNSDLTISAQWFALKAQGIAQLAATPSRCCAFNNQSIDDFTASRLALQARYRLRFDKGASFYLVYSRNGAVSDNNLQTGFGDLFSNAWQQQDQNQITAKISYPWY